MKKFLLILIIISPRAHAMNVTLDGIISFDTEKAMIELAKSLESKEITEKECRRLYTGIYTRAVLQQAEIIRKWEISQDDEPISYFDATLQAHKDVSSIMICPENRRSVREKINHFLTPSPKH